MSRKKEKKIKRLRRLSIWHQVVEAFIVEVVIIIIAIMVMSIGVVQDNQVLVSAAPKTCRRIVELVHKGWEPEQKMLDEESEAQIKNILNYGFETFSGIAILDDDKNILANYGKSLEEDDNFLRYFSKEELYENGVYFKDYNTDAEYEEGIDYALADDGMVTTEIRFGEDDFGYQNNFYIGEDSELKSIINFFNLFYKNGTLSDKEMFAWATNPVGANLLWVMYQTPTPGLNVAILKRMGQTQIDTARHLFMLITLAVCFVFISIYENYKLIVALANKYKLQKLVFTDPITGGNNKDYFIFKAKKYIRKHRRRNVVVYLRMEKYRNYITAYGLKEGENLMEDFYHRLSSLIRKRKELVAHLEKSDFVLLLHYDNDDLLNIRMQAIAKALNDCRPNQHLSFTIGASRIVTKIDNIEEKISNAAAAISKQENPTETVFWFDEAMREEQVWERRVEDDMEKALENNEFQVYLQPKYSTKKEQLSAAEALVRWIHPEYGFVSPGRFIPIFERNGFIIKLDDFMLTEVSKLQAKWLGQGKKLVPISVNVSRAHFSRPDLAEHIRSIVDEYKVPHEYIELELTESAFFDDKQTLLGTVKKLKDFGFKVSMDDFGAGYSSLNSLKELPLDIIKLDAQFFRDIEDKKRADLIVCDTIKLAKKLGMQIVAEGIETREQVDFLAEQHCDLIQGFYFAKPLPVAEFEERAFG